MSLFRAQYQTGCQYESGIRLHWAYRAREDTDGHTWRKYTVTLDLDPYFLLLCLVFDSIQPSQISSRLIFSIFLRAIIKINESRGFNLFSHSESSVIFKSPSKNYILSDLPGWSTKGPTMMIVSKFKSQSSETRRSDSLSDYIASILVFQASFFF